MGLQRFLRAFSGQPEDALVRALRTYLLNSNLGREGQTPTRVATSVRDALRCLESGDREEANRYLVQAELEASGSTWKLGDDDQANVLTLDPRVEKKLEADGLEWPIITKQSPLADFESNLCALLYDLRSQGRDVPRAALASYTTKNGSPSRLVSCRLGINAAFELHPAWRDQIDSGEIGEDEHVKLQRAFRAQLLLDENVLEDVVQSHESDRLFYRRVTSQEEYEEKHRESCVFIGEKLVERKVASLSVLGVRLMKNAIEDARLVQSVLHGDSRRARQFDLKYSNVTSENGNMRYIDFDKVLRFVNPGHERAHIWFDPASTDLTVDERLHGLTQTELHDGTVVGEEYALVSTYHYLVRQAFVNICRPLVVPYSSWLPEQRRRTSARFEMLSSVAALPEIQSRFGNATAFMDLNESLPLLNVRINNAEEVGTQPLITGESS